MNYSVFIIKKQVLLNISYTKYMISRLEFKYNVEVLYNYRYFSIKDQIIYKI